MRDTREVETSFCYSNELPITYIQSDEQPNEADQSR